MDTTHIQIKLGKMNKINVLYQDKFSGFVFQDSVFEGTQGTGLEALSVLFLTATCDSKIISRKNVFKNVIMTPGHLSWVGKNKHHLPSTMRPGCMQDNFISAPGHLLSMGKDQP